MVTVTRRQTPSEVGRRQAQLRTPEEELKQKRLREEAEARKKTSAVTSRRVTATGEELPLDSTPAERASIIQTSVPRQEKEERKDILAPLIPQTEPVVNTKPSILDKIKDFGVNQEEQARVQEEGLPSIGQRIKETTPGDIGQAALLAATSGVGGGSLTQGFGGVRLAKVGKGLEVPVSNAARATNVVKSSIAKSTTAAVNKGTLLSKLWATKIGKVILAGVGVQTILDTAISNYDTANSQFKENIPLIVRAVKNGAITPLEGLNQYREVEEDLNRNDRTLKLLSIFSLRAKLGKLQSAQNRIAKIRDELVASRQDILVFAANPMPENIENLALLQEELKGGNS